MFLRSNSSSSSNYSRTNSVNSTSSPVVNPWKRRARNFPIWMGSLGLATAVFFYMAVGIIPTLHPLSTSTSHDNVVILHENVSLPLCLVHIGKTSGSTVSCSLGLGYADCQNMERTLPKDSSASSSQGQGVFYFHLRHQTCPKHSKTYVITVRNPLTRIMSWYDFESTRLPHRTNARDQERIQRQRAHLFEECYPPRHGDDRMRNASFRKDGETEEENGIVALARYGLQPLARNETLQEQIYQMPCQQRAWAAVLGAREVSYHEYFNYEYYWGGLRRHNRNENASFIVLRTEHLQHDWNTALSQQPLLGRLNSNDHDGTTELFQSLPGDARINLCRALCLEIQYYFQFLQLADNLTPHQVQDSVRNVRNDCPEIDIGTPCPDNIPNFPPLYVYKSQYARLVKKRFYRPLEK